MQRAEHPGRLGNLPEVVSLLRLGSICGGRFSPRLACRVELLVQTEVDVVRVDVQQQLREFPTR